jgi:sigma-E factor negative regulatory protein RseA
MTSPVDDPNAQRWIALSALCDGEASASEADGSFDRWRDDPALRARWHQYQWIGDVMRSDDLASDVEHDQAFLLAVRARMATEPVVLAPQRQGGALEQAGPAPQRLVVGAATGARRQRWAAPAAMAAGVMVVAGALVVIRGTTALTEPPSASLVATSGSPMIPVSATGSEPNAAEEAASAAALGEMVRNPALDRYLAVHRQFAQSPALTTPGGVRQVAVTPEGH